MSVPIVNLNCCLGPAARVSPDRPHAGFPAHYDVFHSIGGGTSIKSRVDVNGNVISSDIHETDFSRLVENIRRRYSG